MAIDIQPGRTARITIKKQVDRASARKTLERLFLRDKTVSGPVAQRSSQFKELPKRRGGCIWTKRPNKLHLLLNPGDSAELNITPQVARDLGSVEVFVEVA